MNARRGIPLLLLLLSLCATRAFAVEDGFGARLKDDRIEPDPAAVGRLMEMRGHEFVEAFHEFSITHDVLAMKGWDKPFADADLARVLEHGRAQFPDPAGETSAASLSRFCFEKMLAGLIAHADSALLDRLARLLAQSSKDGFHWAESFDDLTWLLLRREFAALQKEGVVPVKIDPFVAPAPAGAPPVSPTLRDAWRRFAEVAGPERMHGQPRAPGIAFSTHMQGYTVLLDHLLLGDGTGLADKLAAYFSDSSCNSQPLFTQTVQPARWLALVRERRLQEALAVSFSARSFSESEKRVPVQDEFVTLCGLDPSQLDAGWWLSRLSPWKVDGLLSYSNAHGELERLAGGSEQHARWVVEMAQLARGEEDPQLRMSYRASFIDALGMIVQRRARDPAQFGPFREAGPLAEELRHAAAAELTALVEAHLAPQDTRAAIEKVGALGLRGAIEPLRRQLAQPPAELQLAAAAALRALGEDVIAPVIREPVRLRLVSGGRPLARPVLNANFPGAPKRVLAAVDGFVSNLRSDENGVVAIPWEDYQSVARVASRMVLGASNWDVTHPGVPEDTNARFFEVQIPLVAEPARETVIDIPTQRVTLRLEFARPQSSLEKQTIDILLTHRRASTGPWPEVLGRWKIPALSELTTWVQPGTYEVCVVAPGHRIWKLKPIEIGDQPVTVAVKLEPGTDVKFEFVDATGASYAPIPKLTPDRADPAANFSRRSDDHHSRLGLPAGRYSLAVPSSEEWHASRSRGRPLHESAPRYAGKVVEFEIPASLPPELDLGRIVVPRKDK